jgi:hypothetical protein
MFFKITKIVLLSAIIVLPSKHVFGQYHAKDDLGEYSHSIGISYLGVHHSTDDWKLYKSNLALMYNLRADFKLGYHSSIGVSLFPTIGYAFKTNFQLLKSTARSQNVVTAIPLCYEIPFLIQFNKGNHSTGFTRYKYGSFIGAGVSYSHYPETNVMIDKLKNVTISSGNYLSFYAGAGLNFRIKKMSYGVKIHYTRPLGLQEGEIGQHFGISLMYNFAKHFKF